MHMFPHNTTVAHCIFQYNSFFPLVWSELMRCGAQFNQCAGGVLAGTKTTYTLWPMVDFVFCRQDHVMAVKKHICACLSLK